MSPEIIITFIMISTLLCFSPGPDNILILSQSAINGRKVGVYITLGLCIGLLIHTLLVFFGISALIKASPIAIEIIRLFGASYLTYLAWGAFNTKSESLPNLKSEVIKANKLIQKGAIMNLSNPKVIIFFLAFLPQFTSTYEGALSVSLQFLYLGLIFTIVAFTSFSLIAYLSGFLSAVISTKPSIQTILNKISSVVFLALAINLLISNF
ncbi:LysE family translocator [Marinomonas sp. 2405UD68-3]|uniref:LysE family translocator n=1 Tax=Marinomonas sp. 2405UD68-3 TaxID=3391835 RepID=UPI0039C9B96C